MRQIWIGLLLFIFSQAFAQIEINVRWDRPRGHVTKELLGVNVWGGFDLNNSTDPFYQETFDWMAPGLVRFHASESRYDSQEHDKGWADSQAKSWDVDKIAEAMGSYIGLENIVMNVPGQPDWLDANANGKLDVDEFDAYAAWFAELVRVVNIELDMGVKYFSPFNEIEGKVGGMDNLVLLMKKCYEAAKAVDPTVHIGGGEYTQPWDNTLGTFIADAHEYLDFFSYHHYVTGDKEKPDSDIFDAAKGIADRASSIRSMMDQNGLDDKPLWLSEYNVFWSWEFDQSRGFQRSIKGAIFNALLLKYAAEAGKLDGCMIWNDCDHNYGVMSKEFEPRSTADLIALKNQEMLGTTVNCSSRKSSVVNAMAVQTETGNAVMLINRSENDTTVALNFSGWEPASTHAILHLIDSEGYDAFETELPQGWMHNFDVPALSILLIKFPQETGVGRRQPVDNYALVRAFPNPFNPTVTVEFQLHHNEKVDIRVFDATGRLVSVLANEQKHAGQHHIIYTAHDQASGLYFIEVKSATLNERLPVTLVK